MAHNNSSSSLLGWIKKEMEVLGHLLRLKHQNHKGQIGGNEALEDTTLKAMKYEDAAEGDKSGATTRKLRKHQEVMDYTNVKPKLSNTSPQGISRDRVY